MARARVLVADDQPDIQEALRLLLKGHGYQVETAGSPAALLEALEAGPFDVLLMDLNYARDTTSGREGLELLPHVRRRDPELPVVVMTAWTTVPLALATLRFGVADFVEKPWDNATLVAALDRQVEAAQARRARSAQAREAAELLARSERERGAARDIQMRLLPSTLPMAAGFTLGAAWEPARGVAGDHYDAFWRADGRLALCLADVSGKGLPAALLAAQLQGTLRALAAQPLSPGEICTRLNRTLSAQLSPEQFVAFVYVAVDTATGEAVYANAGHVPPFVLAAEGTMQHLDTGGPVLGQIGDAVYEEGTFHLSPGDRLILATDGVLEAMDAAGEEFGEDRLRACALRTSRDLRALPQAMVEAARAFAQGSLHDDATVLMLAASGDRHEASRASAGAATVSPGEPLSV